MQQEHYIEGDVRVDRVQLQRQLHQFELDKEKMRNRGIDYSPRFRSGNDLKMTGTGDNRSSSPTFPLNSRVSGKEKRRRVHAWLGAQIRSEVESSAHGCSLATAYQDITKLPNLPAPELPMFATPPNEGIDNRAGSVAKPESAEGSDLLQSKSEFIPGDIMPSYQKNIQDTTCARNSAVGNKSLLTPGTTSHQDLTNSHPWHSKLIVENSQKLPTDDFTGGGDNYCYLYDPVIAKAYTKKYPISPSVNTPPPSAVQNTPYNPNSTVPKYAPASQNFTPSFSVYAENVQTKKQCLMNDTTPANPGYRKYYKPYATTVVQGFPTPSLHFPTKYDEYDMRPIKPLHANVKKSLYGEALSDSEGKETSKVQQPRPYLRRSHTATVSYPIPKARSHGKTTPAGKPVYRTLADVEGKCILTYMRGSPRTSLSPRQKRTSRQNAKDATRKQDKQNLVDCREGEGFEEDLDKTPRPEEEKHSVELTELPVDLKHVKAATKIQAVWKGYRTRKLDPKVVEIRQEVRARRVEQYISVLCHEVQCLKEDLEAERKMKGLQTEAIRYIWSQLRVLQKHRNGTASDKRDASTKRKSPDRHPRSKSNSPRRGTKRGNKRSSPPGGSPRGTPRGQGSGGSANKTPRHASESSTIDFNDETESVGSITDRDFTKKKADVSWKEVPDNDIFQDRTSPKREQHGRLGQNAAEDTDEGRGTLVTDGEGNPAHSSAEDELLANPTNINANKYVAAENSQLKSTIDGLQEQVAQLQEAMLTLSDRILNRSRSDVNLCAWDEGDCLKLVPESQNASVITSPPQKLVEAEQEKPVFLSPEPAISARGEVPRISLKNALTTLRSALSEDELWALCEQAGHCIKSKALKRCLALETMYVRKDGRIDFSEYPAQGTEIDEMYLAPEVLEKESAATVKSSVFSLSVVLWSAADWEMSADQAPQLSQELESLLVAMSQDDITQRAEVEDVTRVCEDHHAKAAVNSLCVCSSLFAEVEDALLLAKSGKLGRKKIAQELSKEQEMLRRKTFKELIVPDINSCTWRANLKPASERVLSPRPRQDPTPHEMLMENLSSSKHDLRKGPRPKVFSVRDIFLKDPHLVQHLNIIPGQRRKNQKAMQLVLRRQSPKDPASAPLPGVPTPPRALRAGVNEAVNANGLSSVILRWHPAKIFDKLGQEAKGEKIIGYRIYVNGHAKGMVAGTKSRALLEGLRQSTEYRVNVRAISALGESDVSNTVIAHITSSPMSRSSHVHDPKEERTKSNNVEQRSSTRRSDQPVPQTKPRLGAIFPKQSDNEKKKNDGTQRAKHSNTGDSVPKDETSPKSSSQKGDDIIDRVLRRYGIQQTAAILPGCASGSTLSPIPAGYRPKSSTSTETNRKSVQSSLLEDITKSVETSSLSSGESVTSENPSAGGNGPRVSFLGGRGDVPPLSQASCDVTAKSLELLAQLKSELLS